LAGSIKRSKKKSAAASDDGVAAAAAAGAGKMLNAGRNRFGGARRGTSCGGVMVFANGVQLSVQFCRRCCRWQPRG
jgi:hypothetical protein